MNLHVDRKTEQLSVETRRLWHDQQMWVVNCLAVEATWAAAPSEEMAQARRGRDHMLAAILNQW